MIPDNYGTVIIVHNLLKLYGSTLYSGTHVWAEKMAAPQPNRFPKGVHCYGSTVALIEEGQVHKKENLLLFCGFLYKAFNTVPHAQLRQLQEALLGQVNMQ